MRFTVLFLLACCLPILLGPVPSAHAQTSESIGVTLSVSPDTVTLGQSATFSWTSTNATSAKMNGVAVPATGSYTTAPSQTMPLSLVVTGPGGSASAQTQLLVVSPTPTAPTGTTPSSPPSTSPGAPHINYTDLNVGSGTGGDDGNGVYVRIFGNHFGNSQSASTVTLGGSLVTNCSHCSWSDTQIIAQLGSHATTGNIVVNVGGAASNGVPFTVTPTTIVFVATNGSDNNPGTFAAPFKTWRAAFNSITSWDNSSPKQNAVIYLEPGVDAATDDGRGYRAAMSTDIGGTSPIKQISIVGYPGGTATVGSNQVENGIHGWAKYLTIANLTITGVNSAIDAESGDIRIINNDLSCPEPPAGLGGTACVLGETGNAADTWVFQGNRVHDTGGNVDKTYHAVYFSTNANHVEAGWNNIGENFKGYCRSILFHSTGGSNLYDLHVHDNVITGGYCDAIGFGSVNPSQGVVEAYNNVIFHVALASSPYGVANEAGIAINSDPSGSTSGTVQIYNNTVVDAGSYTLDNQNGCFGIVYQGAGMALTNNICDQPSSSQPYIEPGSQNVTASHNLWYGAGAAPSMDSSSIVAAPGFSSTGDYSLLSTSPAIGKGTSTKTSLRDIVGTPRPNPPAIGAYQ